MLNCGILRGVAQAQATSGDGFGEWIDLLLLAYLVRGEGGTYLVDTSDGRTLPEQL